MTAAALGPVLAGLADDTRWAILVRLGHGAASASALATEFPVSRQAIAKHLAVLQDIGLVTSEKVGREVRFVPVGRRIVEVGWALEEIGRAWDRRLAQIKAVAEGSRTD